MARRHSRLHDVMRTAFYSLWGVLTLILVFTIGFLVVRLAQQNAQNEMKPSARAEQLDSTLTTRDGTGRGVALYFASLSTLQLVSEDRMLPLTGSTVENCRIAFAALAEGPRSTAAPTLPPTAKARAFYLLPTGELVVDLTRDVESPQIQSASAEWLLVQAIAHTLTQPAIQGTDSQGNVDRPVSTVRLLFEGSPMTDTFPSHIALRDALRPDPLLLVGE